MRTFVWSRMETSIGSMYAASADKGVCRLTLPGKESEAFQSWIEDRAEGGALVERDSAHRELRDQLEEYLAGERTAFDIPFEFIGTEFQKKVWSTLLTIPYGTTMTYGKLAERIGQPRGAQSVGRANGANPIPIIVPCHRVIGSDSNLVGYGGGIRMKEFLLRLEGALLV